MSSRRSATNRRSLDRRRANSSSASSRASSSSTRPSRSTTALSPDERTVREGLREVLGHLAPLIRSSGSSVNVDGMLAFLEDSVDDLKLIDWMRDAVQRAVMDLVDAEIQAKFKDVEMTPHRMRAAGPEIMEQIMGSLEVKAVMASMKKVITSVGRRMDGNMDEEMIEIERLSLIDSRPISSLSMNRPTLFERSDSETSSLSSTWNPAGFVYLQPAQFAKLGERLNRFSPAEARIESLNTLLMTQLGDIVASAAWDDTIREGLRSSVLDANPTVSALALKIHSRLLSAGNAIPPQAAKEAHASLVGAILGLYADKTRLHTIPTFAQGVLFKKKKIHWALIKAHALLAEVNALLPKFWLRYPEKYVREIVNGIMQLLSFQAPSRKMLSPVHLMALVDPKAKWILKWTHSEFGRKLFAAGVSSSIWPNLTSYLTTTLEDKNSDEWSLTLRNSLRNSAKGKGSLSESLIQYAFFCFSAQTVTRVCQFSSLRHLTPKSVIGEMIKFAVRNRIKGPQKLLVEALTKVIPNTSHETKFISDALLPLRLFQAEEEGVEIENACRLISVSVKSVRDEEILTFLRKFCIDVFDSHQKHSEWILLRCVEIADSLVNLRPTKNLIVIMAEVFLELHETAAKNEHPEEMELTQKLKSSLLSVLMTPLGLGSVVSVDGALELVTKDHLFALSQHYENFVLINSCEQGIKLLSEQKFLEEKMEVMLETFSLEGDNQHWRPSPHETENKMKSTTLLFAQLLSAVSALKANRAMRHLILLEKDTKGEVEEDSDDDDPFPNYNESESVFALKLASCVLSDLDCFVFLERNFGVVQKYKNELNYHRYEFQDVVIDRKTLYLDHILTCAGQIGGKGEKSIPELSFTEKSQGWSLTCFAAPKKSIAATRKNSNTMTSSSSLASFLNKGRIGQRDRIWHTSLKKEFKLFLSKSKISSLKVDILYELLRQSSLPHNKGDLNKLNAFKPVFSRTSQEIPAQLILNYGLKLGVLEEAKKTQLLKLLNEYSGEDFVDWFVAVLFLTFRGDVDLCKRFLAEFSFCPTSVVLWPNRSKSVWSESERISFIGHWIETILSEESPAILSIFRRQGISATKIAVKWLNQCFLNVLDFSQICNYLAASMLYGSDFALFFVICVFQQIERIIISKQDFWADDDHEVYLLETLNTLQAEKLDFGQVLLKMEAMSKKYHFAVLSHLKQVI